jgi:carbonic anhydrase/acetyltransferase-like protein (isoleucine patch superfamily)
VVHAEEDEPVILGKNVTVGHMALLHGCRIGENSLIGMGSIVMNGAVVGKDCIIGAGSLVTFGTVIPDGSLAFGRPAKVMRKLSEQEIKEIGKDVLFYLEESAKYKKKQDRAKI